MPHAPIWGLKFIEHWINVLRKHFVRKIANNKARLSSLSVLLFSSRKKITFTKIFRSIPLCIPFTRFKKKKKKEENSNFQSHFHSIPIPLPNCIPFKFFLSKKWYKPQKRKEFFFSNLQENDRQREASKTIITIIIKFYFISKRRKEKDQSSWLTFLYFRFVKLDLLCTRPVVSHRIVSPEYIIGFWR